MPSEIFFILANIAYIIGTGLLAKKVLENRNSIKDYDFTGSMLTTIGLFFSVVASSRTWILARHAYYDSSIFILGISKLLFI